MRINPEPLFNTIDKMLDAIGAWFDPGEPYQWRKVYVILPRIVRSRRSETGSRIVFLEHVYRTHNHVGVALYAFPEEME